MHPSPKHHLLTIVAALLLTVAFGHPLPAAAATTHPAIEGISAAPVEHPQWEHLGMKDLLPAVSHSATTHTAGSRTHHQPVPHTAQHPLRPTTGRNQLLPPLLPLHNTSPHCKLYMLLSLLL